jgi:hypothetical protein
MRLLRQRPGSGLSGGNIRSWSAHWLAVLGGGGLNISAAAFQICAHRFE